MKTADYKLVSAGSSKSLEKRMNELAELGYYFVGITEELIGATVIMEKPMQMECSCPKKM